MHHPGLIEVSQKDRRFAYEAYEFLYEALAFTQKRLGKVPPPDARSDELENFHVTGQELSRGFCDLAKSEFGRMARVVFRMWGINQTDDIGAVVFNLIDADLLGKTEQDRPEDFSRLFDLDDVLSADFEITLERDD